MTDLEMLLVAMLVLAFGALCYVCGKGDLLNIIPLMLQEMADSLKAKTIVRCKECYWYKEECESCSFWPDEGYRDPEHFCGEGIREKEKK